jgi:transcription antitermination factor NusG
MNRIQPRELFNSDLRVDAAAIQGPQQPLLWYALQIHSRLAGFTSSTLNQKGYETFLPFYNSPRRWSDRIKIIKTPLFPGYMFCRFDIQNRLPVLATPGTINIVGAGRTPIPVEDGEIMAIRTIVHSGLETQTWPYLNVGAKIRIDRGPLTGLEGILVNSDKVDRLIVCVNLLHRSVAVEIDRQWASAVTDGSDRRLRDNGYETTVTRQRL